MLSKKNISYFLRYPLMAVMLLWAITLPGQEVEVYRFLLKSTAASSTSATANKGGMTVKEQPVHVFLDARSSSSVLLNLQPLANPLLFLFAFATPVDEALPAFTTLSTGAKQLVQIFLISILPNAP